MVNNKDIGTVLTVVKDQSSKYYTVSNTLLEVSDDKGILLETPIDIGASVLFFDPDGNYYTFDENNYIAQYNFETKEIETLPGQTDSWSIDLQILARLSNGNFLVNDGSYDDVADQWRAFTVIYSIDGTVIETGDYLPETDGLFIHSIFSLSTKNGLTAITFYDDTWDVSFIGTATYSASGLLTDFQIGSDRYQDEFAATIWNDSLYTAFPNDNLIVVRDLVEPFGVTTLPINVTRTAGSIGVTIGTASVAFKGLLKNIDSANPTTSTIADYQGNPVQFTEPGRKFIELTTKQNMDEFLDGEVERMNIDGEEFEIESIFVDGSTYEISMQTPEVKSK